jgi:hypothetical protein
LKPLLETLLEALLEGLLEALLESQPVSCIPDIFGEFRSAHKDLLLLLLL